MFSKPSSRRKGGHKIIELNLVPMLDTFVTLIGFLLYTIAFLSLVSVETLLPTQNPSQNTQVEQKNPLQLTLTIRSQSDELWSPFQKISPIEIKHLADGRPDFAKIRQELIQIKKQFPDERQIVLAPIQSTSYDVLIETMDTVRMLGSSDQTMILKNPKSGVDEVRKDLFPEIVFGNILNTES